MNGYFLVENSKIHLINMAKVSQNFLVKKLDLPLSSRGLAPNKEPQGLYPRLVKSGISAQNN